MKKTGRRWVIPMAAAAVIVLVLLEVFFGKTAKDPENGSGQAVKQPVTVEMKYASVQLPAEFSGSLTHERQQMESTVAEIFYMTVGSSKTELYRICFGDSEFGDNLGVLNTDDGRLQVTCAVSSYPKEYFGTIEFPDMDRDLAENNDPERAEKLYASLMESFNMVLEVLYEDSRFEKHKAIEADRTADARLTYWTLPLPPGMEWEEQTEGGDYRADFYGQVAGEKILLYTVYLGESDSEIVLGSYLADGKRLPVSVASSELKQREGWTDEDMISAGNMMDTINDLILVITSDENFTAG